MSIKAPTRDIGQETSDTLAAQVKLAPEVYAAEAKYSPLYTALDAKNFATALKGSDGQPGLLDLYKNDITPAMAAGQAASSTAQRTADVQDLRNLGPAATAAIRNANPQQKALMDLLNQQAVSDLQSDATVDPALAREISQAVRSGQASRGFGMGRNDVATEGLFRGIQAQQLRQQRRGFAQSVAGMNAAGAVDPTLVLMGRPGMTNAGLLNQGAAGAQQAGAGVNFDPMQNPYAQDYWNTTYNARGAAKIAGNNANAALWGQAIKTVGGLAGGLMGA